MKKAKRKKKCEWCYGTDYNWWSEDHHVFIETKIPQLSESPEYFDHWEAENVQLRRRMRASSDPQAYCLWPVWTIEWVRAMEQKKRKKIQVIGRINWGPMKCIFQEKLEEWV